MAPHRHMAVGIELSGTIRFPIRDNPLKCVSPGTGTDAVAAVHQIVSRTGLA